MVFIHTARVRFGPTRTCTDKFQLISILNFMTIRSTVRELFHAYKMEMSWHFIRLSAGQRTHLKSIDTQDRARG